MSLFGTSNICWVPEGDVFRFIDLHRWAEWRLDIHRWRLALAGEVLVPLRQKAQEMLNEREQNLGSDPEFHEAKVQGERMLESLAHHLKPLAAKSLDMEFPQGPLATAWVRVSDMPLESFHDDDYETFGEQGVEITSAAVDGALALPACHGLEIPLPKNQQKAFSLALPSLDAVGEYPLATEVVPPITDEFCGLGGNSNRGKMTNLTIEGRIAAENPICIPLSRDEESDLFVTLYLLFQTDTTHAVSVPLQPSQTIRIEATLKGAGFEPSLIDGRNTVWTREGDTVQTLWDLPGQESMGAPNLPPLLAVPQAGGKRQPKEREVLLANLLQEALGKPKK